MTQSSSADVAPPGALPARRRFGPALAPRNWRVASRLIVLVAIPTMLGLMLAGLRVADATGSAEAYGQFGRLAVLGQQVTGLSQAMEDERAETAAFIADGRPAAGLVTLDRQYVISDGWAATVRRLTLQLGRGYPVQARASAGTVLATIAELPGLRKHAAQSQAPALTVINGYSAGIAGLLLVNNSIADLSGNSALLTSVRTLGSLSGMEDQASLQQAILGAALAEGHFGPGTLTALTIAEAQQASDLVSFHSSATPEQSWALTDTLAGPLAGQARAVEQRATVVGNGTLALGGHASQQFLAGMSYTVGWMGHADQQLAGWITAYARALQRNAMRSAMITGGAALAVLILLVLATMIIARSVVRPLRRLEAAALDVAGTRLPAEVRALGPAGNSPHPPPVTPIDVQSTDEIGQVARAVDRVHREAVRLAGEEARLRGSVSAIFASFLRRSSALQEPLLRQLDSLELGEDDPERLAALFQMDHLATRMRRNSDSALVLAGHQAPRRWTEPVTLVDVLRAALSEIEHYDRVIVDVQSAVSGTASGAITASAAVDIVHLLAELLENATTFSPATAQAVVSGRAARGGGWLISIADGGMGIPEEQLRQLNWQLAHPPLADAAVARHMGLFAVSHLAARQGINVTIGQPPGGGTTAEVHIPAGLISHGVRPGGWPGQAGDVLWAGVGEAADALAAAADPRSGAPRLAVPRLAAGPEVPVGPEITMPDAVPMPLGAPLPSQAPAASFAVTVPEPTGGETAGLPIFESVESEYLRVHGSAPLRPSEPQVGQPALTGRPASAAASASRTSAADDSPAAAADTPVADTPVADTPTADTPAAATPAAGGLTSAGLPQRTPQANLVPGTVVDREAPQGTVAESAQIARSRLATFQQGSRRARAVARMDRDAKPAQDD
jgi:signal transduction histidine kinase